MILASRFRRWMFFTALVACGGKSTAAVQDGTPQPPDTAAPVPSPSPPPSTPAVDASSPSIDAGYPVSACGDPATGLAGAAYDITRSRFAFGSTPTEFTMNGMTRWTGKDGVVVIRAFGATDGIMNGGAPESALPDWSEDPDALTAHVRDYWIAMGIPACQILRTQVSALVGSDGTHQRTILLERALDQIPISESRAFARFNNADQSTSEGFLFPSIPPDVVAGARAFRDQIADPSGLAAYKAKLPAEAQGQGELTIHHSAISFVPNAPFKSAATWDVLVNSAVRSYDINGMPVASMW
jgi:hypothetical protein